jgi:cytochrome b involved in lipid metabolism
MACVGINGTYCGHRKFTLAEVAEHRYVDDAWIAVDGSVYDITDHLLHHDGWSSATSITTPLSILAHAGMECSAEFHQLHRTIPVAYKQLAAFYVGELQNDERSSGSKAAPSCQ